MLQNKNNKCKNINKKWEKRNKIKKDNKKLGYEVCLQKNKKEKMKKEKKKKWTRWWKENQWKSIDIYK